MCEVCNILTDIGSTALICMMLGTAFVCGLILIVAGVKGLSGGGR